MKPNRMNLESIPLRKEYDTGLNCRSNQSAPSPVPLLGPCAEGAAPSAQGPKSGTGDGALWLLRQLRPVSYSFRRGMDSKFMRFGFIADELESVVPEVVRRPGDREVTDQKAVVYQDLIALLAAASQSQQKLIEQQQSRVDQLETKVDKLVELL